VTMGALNTLAFVGSVVLARRRGGLPLMFATALAIALMCQSLPAEAMHDIWNPAAALFPFLLLIFTCWSIACGDQRLLPLAVLLASFVTQTHLVYALPVALLAAVALAGVLARLPRRRHGLEGTPAYPSMSPARLWPWALSALVLAMACWAPPATDQIGGRPGNLTLIGRAAEHRGPTLGARVGWHAVARSVGVRPWWLYVPASQWQRKREVRTSLRELRSASTIAALGALLLVALAGARARRGDIAAAAAIGLCLCAAIGVQAASNPSGRTIGATLGYTLWWGSEVGLWVWLTIAWAGWLAAVKVLRDRVRLPARVPSGTVGPAVNTASRVEHSRAVARLAPIGGVAGVLAVALVVAAGGKPDSHVYVYRPIKALGEVLERSIPRGETIAYHAGRLGLGTQPIEPALRFLLVRHGVRPLADGALPRLGTYYVEDDRPVSRVLFIADGARRLRGMTLLARVRFRSPWRREVLSVWMRTVQPAAQAESSSRQLAANVLARARPAPARFGLGFDRKRLES
jgi:hypothetical protein